MCAVFRAGTEPGIDGSACSRFRLAELTWVEARDKAHAGAVVLLPVGAFEQHGPHLPLDVDTHMAVSVAEEVAKRGDRILVAPEVTWGLSGSHLPFAGTISLSLETMRALLTDIVTSLAQNGFQKIALLVTHNSNRPLMSILTQELSRRCGQAILSLFCTDFAAETFQEIRRSEIGGELHAGELETAYELFLRPGLVQLDRAPVAPVEPKSVTGISKAVADMYKPGLAQIGFDLREAAPHGVMGDPTVATARTGSRVFEAMVQGICDTIQEFGTLSSQQTNIGKKGQ